MEIFEEFYNELKLFNKDLFDNPELGYKENRTSQKVVEILKMINPNIEYEVFSKTGIKTLLNNNNKKTMAYIAELDAVYAPSHFNANNDSGAAHNCGHNTQVSIAIALYNYYIKTKAYKNLSYNICFIFIPAEEFVDLDYRKNLVKNNEISFFGGKPEAMKSGIFDDVDFAICSHAIGEEFARPTIEINCDLAGFLYKYYHFRGKASHAGFDPFSGINAFSIANLFNVAVGLNRQQFRDDQTVRINPIIMNNNMATNVIPNNVTIGTDLRSRTVEYMIEIVNKMDQCAKGCAMALNGELDIETEMGYLPFVQDKYLSSFVEKVFDRFDKIPDIIKDRGSIAAAGDIGDLSFMMPCIQISYGGFKGTIHGDDFVIDDEKFVLVTYPEFLVEVFKEISLNIDYDKLYRRTYEEYFNTVNQINK